MKRYKLFSISLLTLITTVVITTFTMQEAPFTFVYLQNSSGYDIKYKFGKPAQRATEYLLKKGARTEIPNSSTFEYDLDISIRGDWNYARWQGLDTKNLREQTLARLDKFMKNDTANFNFRVDWVVTATSFLGAVTFSTVAQGVKSPK